MKAPDYVIESVMDTLKWAMVYCRNYTLQEDVDIRQVNELMEATHEIPSILCRWPEGALKEIKVHLACFNHAKWDDAPDLVKYLENALEQNKI